MYDQKSSGVRQRIVGPMVRFGALLAYAGTCQSTNKGPPAASVHQRTQPQGKPTRPDGQPAKWAPEKPPASDGQAAPTAAEAAPAKRAHQEGQSSPLPSDAGTRIASTGSEGDVAPPSAGGKAPERPTLDEGASERESKQHTSEQEKRQNQDQEELLRKSVDDLTVCGDKTEATKPDLTDIRESQKKLLQEAVAHFTVYVDGLEQLNDHVSGQAPPPTPKRGWTQWFWEIAWLLRGTEEALLEEPFEQAVTAHVDNAHRIQQQLRGRTETGPETQKLLQDASNLMVTQGAKLHSIEKGLKAAEVSINDCVQAWLKPSDPNLKEIKESLEAAFDAGRRLPSQ